MSTVFQDNFDRSNRDLNGDNGWTTYRGAFAISNNLVVPTAFGVAPALAFAVATHAGGVSTGFGIDVAIDVSNTAWVVFDHDPVATTFVLIRGDHAYYYNGAEGFTLLATLSGSNNPGRLRVVRLVGSNTCTVTQNGVSVGSFTSGGSAAKNRAGVYTSDVLAGKTHDNFAFTATGEPSQIALTFAPIPESLHVYLNGVEQRVGVDYTLMAPDATHTTWWVRAETVMGVLTSDKIEALYACQPGT